QAADLVGERAIEGALVGDLDPPAAIGGQERVDELALIGPDLRIGERAQQVGEIRDGVVAEDAGLAPHAAGPQPRPLGAHHRITFVTPFARAEKPRRRQDALAAPVAGGAPRVVDLDAGEVFAIMAADDFADAKAAIAILRRFDAHI